MAPALRAVELQDQLREAVDHQRLAVELRRRVDAAQELQHTQAATGLLYLAVVALLFGEFFSKFLLFAVNIPL